ncbi:hypothetical protein Tco_0877882 [Tanacetum coccineum]|uniref:Retrotransposon gag domain-containing protein n=1 Tax=Tanacetum coccineum TaxID=301880 RepID=A0ABQ5BWE5_9ASTR
MCDDVDINTLTIEQYLALIQDHNRPRIVKPEIANDVEFKMNSNFMRELRLKLFASTDDVDSYEHVRRVLEIVDLFHIPGVTHDAVMLRVFPITLKGRALRWKKRLPAGVINTWDLLEKGCPQHDLNCQQKVHIFYTGLDIFNRRMLDSKGFITLMTPTQALISIQVMADHSHNWYDETTTKEKINDNPDNIDAVQESFKEAHPTKECPFRKRTSKSIENMDSNIRELRTTTKNLQEKAYQLTLTVLTDTSEKVKVKTIMGKENVKEPVPHDLPVVQTYAPPTPFLGHLKGQIGSPYRTHKIVYAIRIPKEIHKLKAQEDEGDMDVGWDITVEDIVHITPPDDDYVAPATSPTLDMQLNEFGKECSDITKVAEMADGNPVKDIKELLDIIKTSDFETLVQKLLHQISQSSYETGKIKREMKSH